VPASLVSRVRRFTSVHAVRRLSLALVLPHIASSFFILLFSNSRDFTMLNRRFITLGKVVFHVRVSPDCSDWPVISRYLYIRSICFIHRVVHEGFCSYLADFIKPNTSQYLTRHRNMLSSSSFKQEVGRISFANWGPRFYNTFMNSHSPSNNILHLKQCLKKEAEDDVVDSVFAYFLSYCKLI
jgi:hypothetical protein